MPDINPLAIGAATVVAFLSAFAYYAAFGRQLERLGSAAADRESPPAWIVPVELVRGLVVAVVVAGLVAQLDISGWVAAAALGLALWVGFPAVLLTGSVLHERVPWRLAAIHAGDWLVKLLLVAAIIAVWP